MVAGKDIYVSGEYLAHNPTWDVEDSAFKASHTLSILRDNRVSPMTICEVGCGAGEILRRLQQALPSDREFWGYEVSPQAFDLAKPRENDRLHFQLGNFAQEDRLYDLIILADVIEHVEDYFGLLRAVREHSRYALFHIPLDMTVHMVLRNEPITRVRREVGHLHYFSKDTALAALDDSGFRILDHRYTPSVVERPKSTKSRLARAPRRLAHKLQPDLAVRVLGGFSLLVLAASQEQA